MGKTITKRLSFLILVLSAVMSFVAVQAVWALDCSMIVSGVIINDPSVDKGIEVADESGVSAIIYGIPDYLKLTTDDYVTITYGEHPCGDLVACSVKVGDDTIILRPRSPEKVSVQSGTVNSDTGCSCDNCYCLCPEDCEACPCDCLCDCTCDGTGPNGPKGSKK